MDSTIVARALRGAHGALLVTALAAGAEAQMSPLESREVQFSHLDTGWVANTGQQAETVAAFHVISEGADWMRLGFSELELSGDPSLGNAATLKITSLKDGYYQILNPKSAQQWHNSSAYFNGDAVLVELISHPGTGVSRVAVDRATIGETLTEPETHESICGVDDRVLSTDPFNARALPIGCTAYIIDDVCGCFGTAGHCATGASVIQFNVPLSNANGSLNNPPPEDQYSVDVSSRQYVNGGIGNDWAYFGVFPNSNTGLKPREAQGGSYQLASAAPSFNGNHTIRITGYGVDSGNVNQVQQTHSGPWWAAFGTTLQYVVDTQGGNSGSPVFNEDTGEVIGTHTHAGCTSSGGANQGTSRNNSGWDAALASPLGVCDAVCPPTSISFYNGSGVNPACMMTTATPVIGGLWQVTVDTSVVPGATFSAVQVYSQVQSGTFMGSSELLINTSSNFLALSRLPATGGPVVHSIPIPNQQSLAGTTLAVQAGTGSDPTNFQLCNAEVVILGCTEN